MGWGEGHPSSPIQIRHALGLSLVISLTVASASRREPGHLSPCPSPPPGHGVSWLSGPLVEGCRHVAGLLPTPWAWGES